MCYGATAPPSPHLTGNRPVALTQQVVGSRTPARVALLLSILLIGSATLFPTPGVDSESGLCLLCGSFGLTDFVLNAILFVPLGATLAAVGVPFRRCVLLAFAFTFTIELLQLSVIEGRDASLGDIAANTLGGAIGATLVARWERFVRPSPREARRLTIAAALAWLAVLALTAWAFQPDFPDGRYWVQMGNGLRDHSSFRGTVHSAQVNGRVMSVGRVRSPEFLHEELRRDGLRIELALTPDRLDPWVAPLFVLATGRREEIAIVSQHRNALVFNGQTQAAIVGLRGPHVMLPDAFSPDSARGPLRVTVAHHPAAISLAVSGEGHVWSATIRYGPELGWILLFPGEVWLGERDPLIGILSAMWIAALALPITFWSVRTDDRCRVARGIAIGLPIVVAGLLLIPFASGLRIASPAAWTGATAAIVAGALLARRITRTVHREPIATPIAD